MSRLLSFFGISTTVVYLCFTYWLVGDRLHYLTAMELNAVGDFFAGIFGPLAILWLVLGFFQQGQELRQNNQALKLQAEELKNSVDQQKELVKTARDQVAADLENINFMKRQAESAMEPNFLVHTGGSSHRGDGTHTLSVSITNVGATASGVYMHFTSGFDFERKNITILDKGNSVRLEGQFFGSKELLDGLEDVLVIEYSRVDGSVGVREFLVRVVYFTDYPQLKITRLK